MQSFYNYILFKELLTLQPAFFIKSTQVVSLFYSIIFFKLVLNIGRRGSFQSTQKHMIQAWKPASLHLEEKPSACLVCVSLGWG